MDRSSAERGVDVAGPSDGRTIVFVHGAVFTRTMWAPQREALSDEYRVVAPDLPGHGALAAEEFELDAAVERVGEAVEAHANGDALLVGLSLGGYVSTEYVRRHPDAVEGLVLSGSSANPVGGLDILTRIVAGAARLATESDRVEGTVADLAARWVRGRDLPPAVESEIVDAGFYPEPFGDAGPYLAGRDFRAALSTYPGPSLVLNGEHDLLMRRGEEDHAGAARDGRVTVLDGVGHVCNLERSAAYTDEIRTFARVAAEQR